MKVKFLSLTIIIGSLIVIFRGNLSIAKETSPSKKFESFMEKKKLLLYDREDWKRMRQKKEEGTFIKKELAPLEEIEKAPEEKKRIAEEEEEKGLGMYLPYESELRISGRKEIKIEAGYRRYPNSNATQSPFEPDIEQKTQIRIDGTVGKRVKVKVDYDDTVENQRDISIVYRGLPGEVIQEAEFGDVSLSLPGSEFVSYAGSKKSLFGGRVSGQYKDLRFMAIGSMTKGIPEVKKFTGKSSFEKKDINDNAYIRRKYYAVHISSSDLPLSDEKIYIDDKLATNNIFSVDSTTMTVKELTSGTTYYGFFDRQIPGRDYFIDYRLGVITFKKTIAPNYIIAVSYKDSNGTLKYDTEKAVIKAENEISYTQELKNYYNLRETKIIQGVEGRDFIVKILDKNRNEVPTISNVYSLIEVDYDAGILRFKDKRFFANSSYFSPACPDVYYNANPMDDYHHYIIYVEYKHRKKTFMLKFNIVEGSERVLLDGKLLKKDADYMIDYTMGSITFAREEEIMEDSKIEVSYEYSPYGSESQQGLVGVRGEYTPSDKFFLGATAIYNGSPRPLSAPDLRSVPSSAMVYDANTKLILEPSFLPLKTTLSGEIAHSITNPNVFDKAMIDNMEGILITDAVSMNERMWRIAANPDGSSVPAKNSIAWNSDGQEVSLVDINPNIEYTRRSEPVPALKVDYNLPDTSKQASISYVLSTAGIDYSRKTKFRCYIYGNGKGENLEVTIGNINEDADNDGKLDTEDMGLDRLPNTGDLGENDDKLSENEDTGWWFDVWKDSYGFTGRLDTEDLDKDGTLDADMMDGTYGSPLISTITWTGWQKVEFSLDTSTSTNWMTIKHLRLTLKGASGNGSIKIAMMEISGNRWEGVVTGTGTLSVSTINNEENYGEYKPLSEETKKITVGEKELTIQEYYRHLYPDVYYTLSRREQSIRMNYASLTPGSTAYAMYKMRSLDFSGHNEMLLLVHVKDSSTKGTFFVQAMGSDNDYFEYRTVIDWTGWELLRLTLNDVDGNGRADTFEVLDGTVTVKGKPNLMNITQIKVGIKNETAADVSGELWVDELHLSGARKRSGLAGRVSIDTGIQNWFSVQGSYRGMDRNFETITAPNTMQDNQQMSLSGRFDRLKFLPINGHYGKSIVTTPRESFTPGDVETYTSSYEEGTVTRYDYGGGTSLIVSKLPNLHVDYSGNETTYSDQDRGEKSEGLNTSLNYALPFRFFLLPQSINGGWRIAKKFTDYPSLDTAHKDFHEKTQNYSLGFNMEPVKKFPVNVSYNLRDTDERVGPLARPRSGEQSINLNSSVSFIKWFQPEMRYSVMSTENYTIPATTSIPELKDIARTSSAELSFPFIARSLLPKFKPVSDLDIRVSYRFNDGDNYKDVNEDFYLFNKWGTRTLKTETIGDFDYNGLLTIKEGRLKSYSMQDTSSLYVNWSPLKFLNLSNSLSPLTNTYLRYKYTGIKNNSQTDATMSQLNKVAPSVELTVKNIEKLFLSPNFFRDAQVIGEYSNNNEYRVGISTASGKTYSIDTRFRLFNNYSFWVKYIDTENMTEQTGQIQGQSYSRTWNGNLNFRWFENWQFILGFSNKNDRTWSGEYLVKTPEQNLKDDTVTRTVNMDFNSTVGLSGMGLNLPGSARLHGTILRWEHRDSPLLGTASKIDDKYSTGLTVEYDQRSNLVVSFGLGGEYYNSALDENDYWNINLWGRVTLQF